MGGWDGIAIASSSTPWVPVGPSGWELSTEESPKGKASRDYSKRTEDPGVLKPASSTFVFAAPRPWREKDAWESERKQAGPWADIKVIDVDDLVAWIEDAPLVELWLSRILGKPPGVAQDLEGFWASWSSATRPPFSGELLLAGRDEAVDRVREWLAGPSSVLVLRGETEDESIAFLAAAIDRLPESEAESIYARAAVVSDHGTWRELVGSQHESYLVPNFADRADTTAAVSAGHHVLVPVGRDFRLSGSVLEELELPRLRRDLARVGLEAMGVEGKRLDTLSDRAGRGIPLLRRELGALVQPRWARPEEASTLVAAALAGQWKADNEVDRQVLAKLSSRSYEELETGLVRWANEQDRPVRLVGSTWLMISREDSWSLLAWAISGAHLGRLEAIVLDALGEVDPKFELPPAEQWAAGVRGMTLRHSSTLRAGLADTLAILGGIGSSYPPADSSTGPEWACRIVRKLTESLGGWQAWASLAHYLPSLAEACPEGVLDSFEQDLASSAPALPKLFFENDADLFISSPHAGVLWALESLAWSADHLSRVTLILGHLAELDPGGRLSNRPSESLHGIFRLWFPGTRVHLEGRLASIDALRIRHPQVAWSLLLALLPEPHEVATPTHEPRWRDWLQGERPGVTHQERMRGVHEIVERLLEEAGSSPSRWAELAPRLDDLPKESFDRALESLSSVGQVDLTSDERARVHRSLRLLISHHAEFPDADWSMNPENLNLLLEVQALFESEDAVERARLLFARRPLLLDSTPGGWEERDRVAALRQDDAVREIFNDRGLEGIISLGAEVEDPWAVGRSVARSQRGVPELEFLARSLDGSATLRGMAFGYLSVRGHEDLEWTRSVLADPATASWNNLMRARLLILLPFGQSTWDLVGSEQIEVQDAYWSEVRVSGWGADVSVETVESAVPHLQAQGRFAAAVDLLGLYGRGAKSVLIANALEQLASEGPEEDNYLSHIAYEIGDLLGGLQPSEDLPLRRIVRLEWTFFELKGQGKFAAERLQRGLATDPDFFVEVLKLAYKAKPADTAEPTSEDEGTAAEVDENRQRLASRAFSLFYGWRTPPGLTEDGNLDPGALREWLRVARELAAAEGRAEIADEVIGQALVYVPDGNDGVHPPEAVRDLFEELGSPSLENGYVFGVLNARGVTSRSLDEGGLQESSLAARYRASADAVASWPVTSRLLRALAAHYEADARREDRRAELHEEGIWTRNSYASQWPRRRQAACLCRREQ